VRQQGLRYHKNRICKMDLCATTKTGFVKWIVEKSSQQNAKITF
jgi:hypothetical protein